MNIVEWLRRFNQIRDDLLMELSSSVLLLGFAVGTVDVLTRGGWTSNSYFQTGWAVAQALTIDVLFFAVWGRIGRAQWQDWKQKARNVIMIFVGVLLAFVAALVNGLVNYQQLLNLRTIAEAMQALHIDQADFTIARSILIVMVAILIALFGRSKPAAKSQPSLQNPLAPEVAREVTPMSGPVVSVRDLLGDDGSLVIRPSNGHQHQESEDANRGSASFRETQD